MPAEGVVVAPLVVFFAVLVLAVAGRLLMLSLKLALKGRDAVRGERLGLGKAARVAAVFGFLAFGLALLAYQSDRSERRSRLRRQEAKSNLWAIRSLQVAHFAEWNSYVGNQPLTPVPQRAGHAEQARWDRKTRFSVLGFAPEGDVSCSYALEGPDYPADGFTVRAECDFDGKGMATTYWVNDQGTEIRATMPGEPWPPPPRHPVRR
jgi:hypothetical protein